MCSAYEEHVTQNNERLVAIRELLLQAHSFGSAARELLDWCSDVRAFRNYFERNLISCLEVVQRVAKLENFDLDIGYRLLNLCYNNRHRVSVSSSSLLEQWNQQLANEIFIRNAPNSSMEYQKANTPLLAPGNQQELSWNGAGAGPRAVSVVTTVYPGTMPTGYQQQYSTNKMTTGYPPSYKQSPNYGQMEGGYPHTPNYGSTPINAAQMAAAAVATATATAVALDHHSQQMQSPQYNRQQQVPLEYQSNQVINGSQNYMVRAPYQNQRFMQQNQQPGQIYRSHPQMYQPARYPVPQSCPPQYPGVPRGAPMPVTNQYMPTVQGYGPMPNVRRHIGPPGQYVNPNGSYGPMPSQMQQSVRPINGAAYYPGPMPQQADIKPIIRQPMRMEEPRFTMPMADGCILQPFVLEHNLTVSEHDFYLGNERFDFNTLMKNPDYELQLKCFHREDRNQGSQWPHRNQQMNVHIFVNGRPVPLPIQNAGVPLYIKDYCVPNKNTLQIHVLECCCSHFFGLQLVHRPLVSSIVRRLLETHMVPSIKAKDKLKHMLSQPGAEIESFKMSLQCPITTKRIVIPCRGQQCTHMNCFDLENFLLMNKEKLQLQCPICSRYLNLDILEIDQFVGEILTGLKENGAVTEVVLDSTCNWRLAEPSYPEVKREMDPCPNNGPPMKRFKSEPGALTPPSSYPGYQWNGPASLGSPANSVLSPHYSAPAPVTTRYGPPTPATPLQNPPSVGQPPMSVEPQPQTQQQISQQQDCSSIAGSAPYTPASVGSAGSGTGPLGSGPNGSLTQPVQTINETTSDLDGFPFDSFLDGSNQLLSDFELQQYLDQTDLTNAKTEFGGPEAAANVKKEDQSQKPDQITADLSTDDLLSLLA